MKSHNVVCPWCNHSHTAYHMLWDAILCQNCRESIPNPEHLTVHIVEDKLLSVQSARGAFSDNYWCIVRSEKTATVGFHSWASGPRLDLCFELDYDQLALFREAIDMVLEVSSHGVPDSTDVEKNRDMLSDPN